MSEGRWRQIANGYQVVSRGTFTLVVNAPAETVARMAHSVDVTPEELEEAGRPDAADELRNLNAGPEATDRGPTDLDDRIARMKANPRQRWWLEKIIEIVEDCGPA